MVLAADDFEEQYQDLRSEYYDLVDKYTHYKEEYLDASGDYDEVRYERYLGDVRDDFSSLEDDITDLIEDVRDADGSEALIDDLKDLRENTVDFQNRIDDLIGGYYSDYYYSDDYTYHHYDYYYDEYGYYLKEPVKAAPEPPVKVEPLNVYFVSSNTPTVTASAIAAPKTVITNVADMGTVLLLAGIVITLAVIIFLVLVGTRKKK